MPDFIPVAARSAVPEGRGMTVLKNGRNVALFNVAGEIFALDGVCPHKGGPLGEGFCEEGHVFCPMHGWKFDVRTGACVDRPDKPAESLPVRIAGEMIEVAL
jgi:nitrite reductase (NADH) small subunit